MTRERLDMESLSPSMRVIEKPSECLARTGSGQELQGAVQRVTRHAAIVEFYDPQLVLRTSEVLDPCQLHLHERAVYRGRAVVTSIQTTGSSVSCELALDPGSFTVQPAEAVNGAGWSREFGEFLRAWQGNYRVRPEYKTAVADLQSFLADLRLWLNQVELAIRATPAEEHAARELEAAQGFAGQTLGFLTALFEACEAVTARLAPDEIPAHRSFARRQLHPLLLCSPFCHRTFYKPLGYAGDYEMVNMITRDPREGASLFARVVNCWFLAQAPAEAHRNRIDYLLDTLTRETARLAATGRPARIFNLGCGPAVEIQRFIAETELGERTEFTLADFSEETLRHTRQALESAQSRARRRAQVQFVRRSVNQLLKETARQAEAEPGRYDLVYCAGLTDYLTDPVCQRLIELLHRWVAPGGLLVITNVDGSNPRIETMEQILEWHLIYRSASRLAGLAPAAADPGAIRVFADLTGVNNQLEVRKPRHA